MYERLDWRDMVASRSITANCGRNQTAYSKTNVEGADLHLILKESERLCKSLSIIFFYSQLGHFLQFLIHFYVRSVSQLK